MIFRPTASLLKLLTRPMPMAKIPAFRFSNSRQTPFTPHQSEISTNHLLSKNVGLNKFMQKVYTTTGLSILGALSTSYVVLNMGLTAAAMSQMALVGTITSLVGLIGSSFMRPEYQVINEMHGARERLEWVQARNSPLRMGLYGMGIIGLGLAASPLMAYASYVNPTIVPTCLGLTGAIFGGASLVAYKMPKDSMLGYGKILGGSLIGLIALQLLGLASSFIVGPNAFSAMMMYSSSYFAVGLFSIMIAYDTHFAIKMYELGAPDHLGASVQFVLDFWNIFTSLLNIFSRD